MRTAPLIRTAYLVFLALTISAELTEVTDRTKEHFSKDLGPIHIHVETTNLPPESHTLRWDDRYATLKATLLANFIKELPELNPVKGDSFGPFDASIPELHWERGDVTFENVIVTGIKDTSFIPNVTMQLVPARIDVKASIPNVTVEADINLDTMFEDNLTIRDSAHFKATLLDLVVTAAIGPNAVELRTGEAYQVESAVITIDIKDVQLQIDTKYAKEVKLLLDEFSKHIEDLIVDNDVLIMIIKAVNKELAKIPAKKIVNYLLGPSEPNLKQFGPNNRRKSGRKHG